MDNLHIQKYILDEQENNSLFKLIGYTIKTKKITVKSYALRAAAIINAMGFKLEKGIQHFDAVTNIAHLYERLFDKHPTFIKTCTYCQKEVKTLVPLIDDKILYGKD